jgi:hypothetical protein
MRHRRSAARPLLLIRFVAKYLVLLNCGAAASFYSTINNAAPPLCGVAAFFDNAMRQRRFVSYFQSTTTKRLSSL